MFHYVVAGVIGGASLLAGIGFELHKRAKGKATAAAATANAQTLKAATPTASPAAQQAAAAAAAGASAGDAIAAAALQAAANATNQQATKSTNRQVAVQLLADPAVVGAMTQAVNLGMDQLDTIAAGAQTTVEDMLTVSLDANPGADTTAVAVSVAQNIAAMR